MIIKSGDVTIEIKVKKEGIYLGLEDEWKSEAFLIKPEDAWRLSRALEKSLFDYKDLTGKNPLKELYACNPEKEQCESTRGEKTTDKGLDGVNDPDHQG